MAKRKRDYFLAIRLSPEERDALNELSGREGLSFSEMIRRLLMLAAQEKIILPAFKGEGM